MLPSDPKSLAVAQLGRIVIQRVVVHDREVDSIGWVPAGLPFYAKASGSAPKGIRTPDLHLERVAS